ncbi:MAG: sigma-70 family RNA polymerase sigma factor [Rhodopirellula sp.]|nr:sigma-70 family RNA polymerase sigma factor [Rhodopirellula sp.]
MGQTARIDTSLVRNVIAGEETAWHRLVRLYSPSLDRFMHRCRIPESDRDSLRNEVFAEAFAGLSGFVGQNRSRSFLKWIWVIARHRVSRFVDSEKRRPDRASGGDGVPGLISSLPDPSAGPTADDRAELLRAILNELDLDETDSNLLKMYYMEGRTAAKVGESFGLTDVAVRKKVARLLKRIREQTDGIEDW